MPYDPMMFEKVVIKFLFTREAVRKKTYPYLKLELFDNLINRRIIKGIIALRDTLGTFPTVKEFETEITDKEVYEGFREILNMDLTEFSDKYLMMECEKFIRTKLINNTLFECRQELEESASTKYSSQLRDAESFTFDELIGLDLTEDEERMWQFMSDTSVGIPYGIKFLDKNTKNGMHPKELYIFMAETNLGKTLILCSIASSLIMRGKNVLYITLEISEEKIAQRVLANLWDTQIGNLDAFDRAGFSRNYKKMREQITSKMIVKEYPPRSIDADTIHNLIADYKIKKGHSPDVVMIDYLELMDPCKRHKTLSDNGNTTKKVVSEETRAVAVEYELPIVTAWQTNRGGIGKESLDLTDSSESIGTMFTADGVFGVTQPEELAAMNSYAFEILKNRNGKRKIRGVVKVNVDKMRIYDEEGDANVSNDVNTAYEESNADKSKIGGSASAVYVADKVMQENAKKSSESTIIWE